MLGDEWGHRWHRGRGRGRLVFDLFNGEGKKKKKQKDPSMLLRMRPNENPLNCQIVSGACRISPFGRRVGGFVVPVVPVWRFAFRVPFLARGSARGIGMFVGRAREKKSNAMRGALLFLVRARAGPDRDHQ